MAFWSNLGNAIAGAFRRGLDEVLARVGYANLPESVTTDRIIKAVPDAAPSDIVGADQLMRASSTVASNWEQTVKAAAEGGTPASVDLNTAPENPLVFEAVGEAGRYKVGITIGIYDGQGNRIGEWGTWTYLEEGDNLDGAIKDALGEASANVEQSPGKFGNAGDDFEVRVDHFSFVWKRF